MKKIYVFKLEGQEGLKIGETRREDVKIRVKEQFPKLPTPPILLYETDAIKEDGTEFTDRQVGDELKLRGHKQLSTEFFECDLDDIVATIKSMKKGIKYKKERMNDYRARREQKEAIEKATNYFSQDSKERKEFLWNAKMRFGKTFATYKLMEEMKWKKILILTYKPGVMESWKDELEQHIDFEKWVFINKDEDITIRNEGEKEVYFFSFQKISSDKKREKDIYEIFQQKWDCIVVDESHYGSETIIVKEILEKINTENILYLSGTPFKAISNGKFSEEQIYTWTYIDEQRAKKEWEGDSNPYSVLPEMQIFTYKLPDEIMDAMIEKGYDVFDLNIFFKTKEGTEEFLFEEEVQKWLDYIRGKYTMKTLEIKREKTSKTPYGHNNMKNKMDNSIWLMPNVPACNAMEKLLKKSSNVKDWNYEIYNVSGNNVKNGEEALKKLKEKIKDKKKTITLTQDRLTTGVSIPEWTSILVLSATESMEKYFQSIFRVQTPWYERKTNQELDIKKEYCYVFDFDPNRVLKQIVEYNEKNKSDKREITKKIEEFLEFMPIYALDEITEERIDVEGVFDMIAQGTTAKLMARGWNSDYMLNLNKEMIDKISGDKDFYEKLMKIEGFRKIKDNLNVVITSNEKIKKGNMSKKELGKEKNKYENNRKIIMEKLKMFVTRIPLFMYLTDNREETLRDIIIKLEPELFKRVTGIEIDEFQMLLEYGVFKKEVMDKLVYTFRMYEESSVSYTGINKHKGVDFKGF